VVEAGGDRYNVPAEAARIVFQEGFGLTRQSAIGGMILLLLGIVWISSPGLRERALWYDEWFSVYNAGGGPYGPLSIGAVWGRVMEDIFETPGHYLLLAEWGRLVGWTEFAVRASSLFLGLLAISGLYRLGRDLFSPLVGFSAAVCFGFSALLIHYLLELRTYTLLTLLTIVVIWAYWRLIYRARTLRIQLLFVASTAALLYAHYMGLLIPAALGLYHLALARRDRFWWPTVGLFALAFLLFALPWSGEIIHTVFYARTSETRQMLALSSPELLAEAAFLYGNASAALLVFLLGVALGARGRPARFVGFVALAALGSGLLVNLLLPVLNHVRYLMPAWPPLALLLGVAVQRLQQRGFHPGLVLGIWIAAGIWNAGDPAFATHIRGGAFAELPWHTLTATLGARAQPDDAIAYHRPDDVWAIEQIADYYLGDLPGRYTILEKLPGRDIHEEFFQQAQLFIDHAARVWLVTDKTRAPNFRLADFQRALAAHYQSCGTIFDHPRLKLDLYSRTPQSDAAPAYVFGAGIGLNLVEPLPPTARAALGVTLGWQVPPDVPPYTYSAALHIENASGALAAQTDFGLPDPGYTCLPVSLDLRNLPPGDYRVLVMVYAYETGQRLPGRTASGDQTGERLLLGHITVEG
jgi:hypothetical protein